MATTTFVDGQTVIEAAWLNDVDAAVYTPGTVTAASIANVPAGSITATDVQTALNGLDTDKIPTTAIGTTVQAYDALLTSLAAQTTAANKVQAYSGADTASLLTTGTASGNIPLVGTSSATTTLAGLSELADSTEALAGTDALKTLTPATLRNSLAATGTAPIFACRAWVNFDASSGTPTIVGSGNVASITDNGVGDFTVNFTTAMPDANYAIVFTNTTTAGASVGTGIISSKTASAVRFTVTNNAGTAADYAQCNVVIFR